jgi:hypothetical protein
MRNRSRLSLVAALVLALPLAGQSPARPAVELVYPAVADSQAVPFGAQVASTDEGSPCQLHRVGNVIIFSTGDFAVANTGALEICLFAASGSFVRKIGRYGSGPGEFQSLADIGRYRGDSILALDILQERLTIFGHDGRPGRELRVVDADTGLGSHSYTGSLEDGQLLLGFGTIRQIAPSPTAIMFMQRIFRADANGVARGEIGTFPMADRFVQATTPDRGGVAHWTLAFGRTFTGATFQDHLIGGDGTRPVVAEFAMDGRLVASHRFTIAPQPVSASDIAQYKDRALKATSASARGRVQHMLDEMPFPKELPVYRRVIPDGDVFWLELTPVAGSIDRRWFRVDPRTRKATLFVAPRGVRLLAFRNQVACGLARDEDDLESIRCFRVP